ncbi:uncharacterized protein BXZ73DRAFT_110878 [Epithele typhae]|uniref:uncharacterized protein n=1 Tax=Epithele typhae TaxID=378194 RepID=UPI002008C40D|nr:uncharacterized protein BXZ73DRAFT_110878 [Epithele typhae]KAH9905532.1 hypothetical protein BXZ73DRAFT_110878 [Epithele typhae]
MSAAGAPDPVVPGHHETNQDPDFLQQAASRIEYRVVDVSPDIKFSRVLAGNQAFIDGDVQTDSFRNTSTSSSQPYLNLLMKLSRKPCRPARRANSCFLQPWDVTHFSCFIATFTSTTIRQPNTTDPSPTYSVTVRSFPYTATTSRPDGFSRTFAAISAVLESPLTTFVGAHARTTIVPQPAPAAAPASSTTISSRVHVFAPGSAAPTALVLSGALDRQDGRGAGREGGCARRCRLPLFKFIMELQNRIICSLPCLPVEILKVIIEYRWRVHSSRKEHLSMCHALRKASPTFAAVIIWLEMEYPQLYIDLSAPREYLYFSPRAEHMTGQDVSATAHADSTPIVKHFYVSIDTSGTHSFIQGWSTRLEDRGYFFPISLRRCNSVTLRLSETPLMSKPSYHKFLHTLALRFPRSRTSTSTPR